MAFISSKCRQRSLHTGSWKKTRLTADAKCWIPAPGTTHSPCRTETQRGRRHLQPTPCNQAQQSLYACSRFVFQVQQEQK